MSPVKANFKYHWLPVPRIELNFEAKFLAANFPSFQLISNLLLPTVGRIIGGNIGKLPRKYFADLAKSEKVWEEFGDEYLCDKYEFQIPKF